MTKCPNKNDEQWLELVKRLGLRDAYRVFQASDDMPDPKQFPYSNRRLIKTDDRFHTMSLGSLEGTKETPEMAKKVEDTIINHPDQKIGGGESFNEFKDRVLPAFIELAKLCPDNTLLVGNSTVLKLIDAWMKKSAPADMSIDMEHFLKEHTEPGELYKFVTKDNRTIWAMRHGETTANAKGLFRKPTDKLTPKGIEEVKRDMKQLDKVDIPWIVASSYIRNQQSAKLIAEAATYPNTFQGQVDRAVDKFGLIPTIKHDTRGFTTKEDRPTKALIDSMNQWFTQHSKYPDIGVYMDTGNPVIQFGSRRAKSNVYFQKSNVVQALPRSVHIAQLPKTQAEWNKLQKGSINFDQFLQNSQFPKEQKELLRGIYDIEHPKTLADLATSMAAKYAYTVEVNTIKDRIISGQSNIDQDVYGEPGQYYIIGPSGRSIHISDEEYNRSVHTELQPTQHYSNLTVPGGTNYTENEISTPDITPSIKGHAQFSTDNGIGWFRSDDQINPNTTEPIIHDSDEGGWGQSGNISYTGEASKTRRILEVQSDLFQKGRDSQVLVKPEVGDTVYKPDEPYLGKGTIQQVNSNGTIDVSYESGGYDNAVSPGRYTKVPNMKPRNEFLQLLNTGGNWITFFIKSIMQDSIKKGYEKVLFPTGNTASKVEGHETVEDFVNQQQRTIDSLKKNITPEGLESHYKMQLKFAQDNVTSIEHNLKHIELTPDTDEYLNHKVVDSKYDYVRIRQNYWNTNSRFEDERNKTLTGDNYQGFVLQEYTAGSGNKITKLTDAEAKDLLEKSEALNRKDTEERLTNAKAHVQYLIDTKDKFIADYKTGNEESIAHYEKELERANTEGFAALKPIYDFYENRIGNTLRKIYGKEHIQRIRDEYGNEWYQVDTVPERDSREFGYQKLSTKGEFSEAPNKGLDKAVERFLDNIGVEVQHIKDQGYNFAAMVDTLRGIIKVVDGKADITTLGHEATHLFLDLLPADSKLLADIIDHVQTTPTYDKVYEQYKDDPEYQDEQGEVDEEKVAKEAAAHIIDDIIADRYKDKKAMKWWDRLWIWIKNLFRGKRLDVYEQVAEDILQGKTEKLSKEKIRKMKEANEKGEIYYQLDEKDRQRVEDMLSEQGVSDIQRALADALYLKPDKLDEDTNEMIAELGIAPHDRVILNEQDHTYRDLKGNEYTSVTRKISGEFSEEKKQLYDINKRVGSDVDSLLQAAILGKGYKDLAGIDTPTLSDEQKADLFAKMREFIAGKTEDGSIPLTQVIVADPQSLTAGSIDILLVHPKGYTRIVDLKTSVNKVFDDKGRLSKTYTSTWKQNEGSVFNDLTWNGSDIEPRLDDSQEPVKLSKQIQHGVQVGSYARMLELQGVPVVGTESWHINIDIQQKPDGSFFVKKWKDEGTVMHNIDNNKPYIDQVVPTQVDDNNPSELQENRPGYDYSKVPDYELPADEVERMKEQAQKEFNAALDQSPDALSISKQIVKTIGQRIQYLKGLNRVRQEPSVKEQTIHELSEMKREMSRALKKNKPSQVLNEWIDFTIRQSNITSNYLSDPANLSSDRFTVIAEQGRKFVQSYDYINGLVNQVHATQLPRFNEAVGAVNRLHKSIDDAIRAWADYDFKNTDTKYLDDEISAYIYGNPEDIGTFTRLFSAPSNTSSIPVSMAFKRISDADFKAKEWWSGFQDNLAEVARVFHSSIGASGYKQGMYDFMTHPDGTFVMREGKTYQETVKNAAKALMDDNGERKTYREGDSDEVKAYNKELKAAIDRYSELTRAEKWVAGSKVGDSYQNGYYEPGEYCEYKPVPVYDRDGNITKYYDYEAEREKFEVKNRYGKWKMRWPVERIEGIHWIKDGDKYYEENDDGSKGRQLSQAEVNALASLEYRNRYYMPIEEPAELEYDDQGVFTGKIKGFKPEPLWVVKPEYRSMRDKRLVFDDNKGEYVETEDLRDPKYIAMQQKGGPELAFYNGFMDLMNKALVRTPAEFRQYQKGKIPVQSASLFTQIMQGEIPQTMLSLVGKELKKFFNSTYIGERQVDENGNIRHSIPIAYTGSFKDQEKIDKLKQQIANLDAAWESKKRTASKAQTVAYNKERKLLSSALTAEELKIQPHQVEKDIVKGLSHMAYKIAVYDQMSEAESEFLMIRELAHMKSIKGEMAQTDSEGRPLFRKLVDTIGTSLKRLTGGEGGTNELKRIDDMMAMLLYHSEEYAGSFMAKLEQLPITLSAINLFLINPPVSLGVSVMMQSIHLKEASVGQFFNLKQYSKARVIMYTEMVPGYIANHAVKDTKGKPRKYGSKGEAWIARAQAFPKSTVSELGFMGHIFGTEHFVEYSGVATGALAIGLNTPIKGKDGTISNTYDIWNYNPVTGDIEIDPNYAVAWEDKKLSLNRVMADYQNRFHGAYAQLERASITQYPLGRSIMYLKKWMPAVLMSTLSPRWVHSNLGIQEGRYITAYNFIAEFLKLQGSIREKWEHGMTGIMPKGYDETWGSKTEEERKQAEQKAYEDDPEFRDKNGNLDEKKVQRDKDTRKMELFNLKRTMMDVVYIMVATGAFMLLRSLAEDTDDQNTKRWANFLAKTFDRLRKQQVFAMPVVGLSEEYQLLKSPIASLRTMGQFAEALSATLQIPIAPYKDNYYTTGVHKGELKAKVKWAKVVPALNIIPWWEEQIANGTYWIK